MANLAQAKKRIRQNEKHQEHNRARKSTLKTETRKLMDAINSGDLERAKSQFKTLTKQLDQVAAKGTLHKKTASRKKSRLAKQLSAALTAKA